MPLSAIANVVGSLIGAHSQSQSNKSYLKGIADTNAANLAIARETNAQNLDIFNKSNQFSERMWNLTNQYNSPAATRARLLQAGISPAAMSEGGSASVVQSVSPTSMTAAKMDQASQVANPYGDLAKSIGGSVAEYYNNQLLKEQLKQSRYATEMKLMDKSFYYGEKERQLRRDEASIRMADLSNYEKERRLSQLEDELNHARTMRQMIERQASAEYDNTVRRSDEIEANTALLLQSVNESAARMAHMSEQERIDWFNARANASLSSAQASQAAAIAHQVVQAAQHDKANFDADAWRREHQSEIDGLSYDEKRYAAAMMSVYLGREREKNGATLNYLLRSVLGVDAENVFSSGFFINRK